MSHTGLVTINSTEINNSGPMRVGNNVSAGTTGQVIKSNGEGLSPEWSNETDTTYQGSSTINIDIATNPDTINCLKVPQTLTFTGYDTGTFDGSSALSINLVDSDTQLSLVGTTPVSIASVGLVRTIGVDYDGDTIILDGADLAVAKVPNTLTINGTPFDGSAVVSLTTSDTTYTAGNGIDLSGTTFSTSNDGTTINNTGGSGSQNQVLKVPNTLTINGTPFDGSAVVSLTTSDTTYTAGTNLNLGGTTFNLDTAITGMTDITYLSAGSGSTLTGNSYPSAETVCTYLDLTSTTNILPTATSSSPFLATKIQETYLVRYIGTSYIEYSTNFRTSFVAQSANVLVEFQSVIAAYSKVFYGGLYDYNAGAFWTTPQTQTRFKYDNGIDQDPTTLYWYLTGLTAGTTYYISPYFKSSSASSYMYSGNSGIANSFPPGIFRVSDGGDNVSVY